jgi:hypothetical protein
VVAGALERLPRRGGGSGADVSHARLFPALGAVRSERPRW